MTSSDYPNNQNKQLQLMMNLSLLSSLKQKQPLPQIPQVTYVQPPTTPSNPLDYLYRNTSTTAQPITVTQMSYHSIYSPHSTILSYKRDDNIDLNAHFAYTPHYYLQTSNPSPYQNHKSYTAMSYNLPHNVYQQQPFSYGQMPSLNRNESNTNYIGHKTARNTILINNNNDDILQIMPNVNNSSVVGNNANAIVNSNNSCNKNNNNNNNIANKNSLLNLYLQDNAISNTHSLISKPIIKHHSAPIKLLHTNTGVFETHCFLKTQSESNNNSDEQNEDNNSENDKKYKCGHSTCDLIYKTKKQKVAHHAKMDLECQKDTINNLKLISELKNMILHLLVKKKKIKNDKTFQKLNQKYKRTMNDISLSEYAEMICGKVLYSTTPQHPKYLNSFGLN